jgi:hypothetical protein
VGEGKSVSRTKDRQDGSREPFPDASRNAAANWRRHRNLGSDQLEAAEMDETVAGSRQLSRRIRVMMGGLVVSGSRARDPGIRHAAGHPAPGDDAQCEARGTDGGQQGAEHG